MLDAQGATYGRKAMPKLIQSMGHGSKTESDCDFYTGEDSGNIYTTSTHLRGPIDLVVAARGWLAPPPTAWTRRRPSGARRAAVSASIAATCPGCGGTPRTALEGIVEFVDAGIYRCRPEGPRRPSAEAAAAAADSATRLQAVTLGDAGGRTCAVCLDEIEPGTTALVAPCDHK
ncbi:hypothetical protein GUJ93_ZPchr0001g33175 [Zizania palustris]|uniref:RING-type domain-containing protein n=1 Tax=Zizania palustris TaxID=103762 RepID=A0A8J5RZ87_ZIZPA|nr:hypothetical protein GUJ93_ZPchr0001g33175 [Zizania palustris]